MMYPINPGHRTCASCWYWPKDSGNPAWCPAALGFTDPAFTCDDWRDLRDRTDPMTGEARPALEPTPRKKPGTFEPRLDSDDDGEPD